LMAVKILRQAAQKFSLEIFVLYSILNWKSKLNWGTNHYFYNSINIIFYFHSNFPKKNLIELKNNHGLDEKVEIKSKIPVF
jgi:hypothetical protein